MCKTQLRPCLPVCKLTSPHKSTGCPICEAQPGPISEPLFLEINYMFRQRSGVGSLKDCFSVLLPPPLVRVKKKKNYIYECPCVAKLLKGTQRPRGQSTESEGMQASFDPHCPDHRGGPESQGREGAVPLVPLTLLP